MKILISNWALVFSACAQDASKKNAFEYSALLGTGVNLGNALDAPHEGDWGVVLQEQYFSLIMEAGFDSVRIPVRWSNHAFIKPPYTIDETFLERVDWAIDQALKNELAVMINVHHYLELFNDPAAHTDRFLGLWEQIALRYKDLPRSVFFEVLNEPNTNLGADEWNKLIPRALNVIRSSNPDRVVVLGAPNWSNVDWLSKLKIPGDDRNIIATFHYYSPHEFTHQSTPWSEPRFRDLSGIEWLGTDEEKTAVTNDLMIAVDYGKRNNVPIYLGEFGVYQAVDMPSRIRWTTFVANEARRLGMTIGYWEFCASFGLYDRERGVWREKLLEAVLP